VINGTVVDKYIKLCKNDSSPVCLFPTQKACQDFSQQMLSALDTELHKIVCVDEIDEISSSRKWSKKAEKELDKLNKNSNLTAGLEAELTLVVGARVMLRRNIDTKQGLVNGAIGTVTSISSQKVMVKFDHIDNPCPIEMVRNKFLLMKSFFVYCKQLPLTMVYAVTIHKCQGLSLDCAIIDLSSNVFCAGMAHVAISRVRTLEGLHLTAFDPASISVNNSCLEEVNRLCSCFRKDLPLYEIPVQKKPPVKCTLLDVCDKEAPAKKKPMINLVSKAKKQSVGVLKSDCPTKKSNFQKVIKIVKLWLLTHLQYHNLNGLTTDTILLMKNGKGMQACDLLGIRFVRPFQ